ncbi:MAG: UDP-N-acetylmuramoylalanyl-D-glutamyl-2,6-diaminopimelate--D-alanyl-D-alanine ligase [Fuerstiella sp.]
MYSISVETVCRIVGGQAQAIPDLQAAITGCVIDSREVQAGDLFFALPGSQVHGLQFAETAIQQGAVCVVVEEVHAELSPVPSIVVPDVVDALTALGRQNRLQSDALIVAVTGSVGKTTTRSMIAHVLASTHTGIQSPRNFNNHLGVPLSLLEIEPGDEFAAIEVGASGPGEVARLAHTTAPEFAVITRIAPAHLQQFESLQAVANEKLKLIESLSKDGVAFLNADDPLVAGMRRSTKARVVTFGRSAEADVRVTDLQTDGRELQICVDGQTYHVPVGGRHFETSIAAAVAVGLEVGLNPTAIAEGLSCYQPVEGRCVESQIGPWRVIDDSYNSSPASVTAAVELLEAQTDCRHRVLIFGDMLDLGEQASDLHFGVGARLAASSIDHVLAIGEYSSDLAEGFLSSGGSINRLSLFSDWQTLYDIAEVLLSHNDAVLIKGSRGMRMERVLRHLSDLAAEPPAEIAIAA